MTRILKQWQVVLCLLASLYVLSVPLVDAAEKNALQHDDARLDSLLEFVGLSAQIARTAETISSEVVAKLARCSSLSHDPEDMARFIKTLYRPEELARSARIQLANNLTERDITELIDWINSPLGKKIFAAESFLQDSDVALLEKLEARLTDSDAWTQERQKRIYRIIRVTRVHHYVAALNTALTAAVTMASSCATDSGSLNSLQVQQQREKSDEKLIAGLMLNSFIVPTGVILQPLDNTQLHNYLLFSVTPTGKKWYAAVIDAVRSMIESRVPDIRAYLEQQDSAIAGSLFDD